MTHIPSCGLVLNINTPNYFESQKKPQRSQPFATISAAKRPKLLGESSFKFSSVKTKLKAGSNVAVRRKTTSSKISPESLNSQNKSVKFNSSVKIIKETGDKTNQIKENDQSRTSTSNNIRVQSKLQGLKVKQTGNVSNDKSSKIGKKSKKQKFNETSSLISSSLFSKNPDIPELRTDTANLSLPSKEIFHGDRFSTLDISPRIVSSIEKMGFSIMMKVQQLGIPPILKGNDALVRSHTGSGKTLVYALPIVQKLMMKEPKISRIDGICAVIVVPTRELALQSYQCFEKLCKSCIWVVPGYLIGGEKRKCEKSRLRKGINILVATPGRLADHIQSTAAVNLSKVEFLVIDEADRMTEMGYEKSLLSIIESLDTQIKFAKQTILLSATLTAAVEKIVGLSLKNPTKVSIGLESDDNLSSSLSMPDNLTQYYMLIPTKLRLVTLAAFVIEKWKMKGEGKILVFMNTQDMIDFHVSLFSHVVASFGRKIVTSIEKKATKIFSGEFEEGSGDEDESDMDEENENDMHFFKLHGSMSQEERSAVFKTFQKCTIGVLFCTDVAARGLHLPEVHWIVQYNPAYSISDYVHRCGRTARANNHGSALVFLDPSEIEFVSWLEQCMIRIRKITFEEYLKCLISPSIYADKSMMISAKPEAAATHVQFLFEQAVDSDQDMYELASRAYTSFIRSYAAIPKQARAMFDFRKLHLGHYAKSFALREAPNVIGQRRARFSQRENEDYSRREYGSGGSGKRSFEYDSAKSTKMSRRTPLSEFDSGLDGINESKIKKPSRGKGGNSKSSIRKNFKPRPR